MRGPAALFLGLSALTAFLYWRGPAEPAPMTEFHCEDGQIAIGPGGGDCGNREAFLLGRKMDLNTATLADLDLIPGFGPKTAEAVIAERERLGGFRSIMALESSGLPGKTKEILIQWTEIK